MSKIGTLDFDNIMLGSTEIDKVYLGSDIVYSKTEEDWSTHYLTFKVLSAGTITFKASSASAEGKTIYYSTNNGDTWTSLTSSTTEQSLGSYTAGSKILVKGSNSAYSTDNSGNNINCFGGTAQVSLCGNIMSLIYGDSYIGQTTLSTNNTFMRLFYAYTNLVDAKNLILPAMTLKNYCYARLFESCTSLVYSPKEFPATSAVGNCYTRCFYGCSDLQSSPVIQLRNLVNYTCWYMFQNCKKLNYIKAMFTTEPTQTRTNSWVSGVAATGTFVKNSAATWTTTGVNGVPKNWTIETASE